jgi:8-oxo-dGTP diphosphatase
MIDENKQSFSANKLFKLGCNTLIIKEGKILLGKRCGGYGSGTWGLPGGHLEFGENLIDGAKRELKEELGLEEVEIEFLSVVEGSRDGGHYIQVNFLLKDFKGEIKLMEPQFCEEWRFFNIDDLPKELFPPHIKIIEAYKKGKSYYF